MDNSTSGELTMFMDVPPRASVSFAKTSIFIHLRSVPSHHILGVSRSIPHPCVQGYSRAMKPRCINLAVILIHPRYRSNDLFLSAARLKKTMRRLDAGVHTFETGDLILIGPSCQ